MTGPEQSDAISWERVAARPVWVGAVWALVWLVTGLWSDPQRPWTDALLMGLVVAVTQVIWDVVAARRRPQDR